MNSKLEQPHDRGNFFKTLGTLLAGFVAERVEGTLESIGPKLLRPPGAIGELAFLTACTRCDKCIEACRQGSIVRAQASAGLAMGTPQIVPRAMPCYLCETFPCIAACPEKALEWPQLKTEDGGIKKGPEAVRIGVAQIKRSRCLAFSTPTKSADPCRVCIDRCPFPESAIKMNEDGDGPPRPEVADEFCTGCGLCEFTCPAPLPGIVVRAL